MVPVWKTTLESLTNCAGALVCASMVSVGCTSSASRTEDSGADARGTTAADDATGSSTLGGATSEATTQATSGATVGSTTDSTSADASSADGSATTSGSMDLPLGEHVIVAVGYGGMRVRSLDNGVSWVDYTQLADDGGDDQDLLRGAAWGAGRFVAVGYRIFSSPDGAIWEEHDNPTPQWYGAVQHGNGVFVAVGGGGACARSSDGMTWEACTDATDDGFTHVRSTLFHEDLFYTADVNGVLRSSSNGDAWTVVDAEFGSEWAAIVDGQIVALEHNAPAELPMVRLRGGGGQIRRAESGSDSFSAVFDIPNGNQVFAAYRFSFAEGRQGMR